MTNQKKVYVIGGEDYDANRFHAKVSRYDIESDQWSDNLP